MHGHIHLNLRSLVIEKWGSKMWSKILKAADSDGIVDFMVFHQHDDLVTDRLLTEASKILGVEISELLDLFGEHFFKYCRDNGLYRMMQALGDTFPSFIQNLDSLHNLLQLTFKNIHAPSFRCEGNEDGSIILHHYSTRGGLHPIVPGLLRATGKEIFKQKVTTTVLHTKPEIYCGRTIIHTMFHVTFEDLNEKETVFTDGEHLDRKVDSRDSLLSKCVTPAPSLISKKHFCKIFPYHVIFDYDMIIYQIGVNICKAWTGKIALGETKVTEMFELLYPNVELKVEHIRRFINAQYVVQLKEPMAKPESKNTRLAIRGEMIMLRDVNHVLFIGSPYISNLQDMVDRHIYLSDIPLYDVTRELVLLSNQRAAEIEISKKLNETTVQLKRTAAALKEEKGRTDMLLHQILPKKVADQLMAGQEVQAEKFDSVTVLFSDIVTFTSIAAAVTPMDVVAMLNAIFSRFDNIVCKHGVYKVETIGDAYMVVGGVPDHIDTHAEQVADMALDMIRLAQEVYSPVTGTPLQVRIGMNTGPVVAGVVGAKMPRYCLFGDTVNTASRMESHGRPGSIHISESSYQALVNKGYKFRKRGHISIKGKGQMRTYFLLGSKDCEIPFEEDSAENDKTTKKSSHCHNIHKSAMCQIF